MGAPQLADLSSEEMLERQDLVSQPFTPPGLAARNTARPRGATTRQAQQPS
jgi:hypothetical protein